ncbi:MAG: POTRA domain-containing protein [Candidatus Latescibacterota bacterium]
MRSKLATATCCAGAFVFCSAAFILLVLCSTGAFGYSHSEPFEQTLSAEGVERVVLGNTDGSVRVAGWERDEIGVKATKSVRARNQEEAEEILEGLRIAIRREDAAVRIETLYPKGRPQGFLGALFGGGIAGKMSVAYEVSVPRKMMLDLTTTNGRVEVEEVSGQVAAHATNGRIVFREVAGAVRARTTNGGVTIEGLVGTFDVGTTNGSIDVVWSEGGAGDCRASTTNGRITVRVPMNLSAVLDAATTNGRVWTEIPLTLEERAGKQKVQGTLGEGGPQLRLRTTNGNIHVVQGGQEEGRVEPEGRSQEAQVEKARPKRKVPQNRGDEVRFVGSVVIDEDEVVEGDAVAIGGSVTVFGKVVGDAVALFGGIVLGPKAVVDGDVVSVGGHIEIAEGAHVTGDIVETDWHGVHVSGGKERIDLDVEALRDRGSARTSKEGLPETRCVWTSEPPVLDGRLDDAVWERAGRLRDFRGSDGEQTQEPTKGVLLWDAEYLYVGVQCEDEDIDGLVMNQRGRDSWVWEDDDVEVFLSRDGESEPYFQFAVNPRGAFYDQMKQSDRGGDRPGWNSDTKVKTYVADRFWSVEMAIPWVDVTGAPKVGDIRRFNVHRKQPRSRAYSYWSPTYYQDPSWPHIASRFGVIQFLAARDDSLRGGIPCSGIEVEGNTAVPSEEILAAIPLNVGDVLTGDVLMDVKEALGESRWFSKVDVALKDGEKGAVVLISVAEEPTVAVTEVSILDGDTFPISEVQKRHGLMPGRFTEEALNRASMRVESLYRDAGYGMVSVSRDYEPASGRLTVTVDEGRIEEIRIDGTQHVTEQEIREKLGIQEGQRYVKRGVEEALNGMKQTIGKFREVTHQAQDGVLTVLVTERPAFESDFDFTVRFNRVESLFLGGDWSAETVFGFQGRAYLGGGYSFGTDAWQHSLGAEKSWLQRYRSTIGVNSHDVVDTPDRWKVNDDEASGLSICGFEPRDYFRRWGSEGYWTQSIGDFGTAKLTYADDRYERVAKNTDWSLFARGHTKRANSMLSEEAGKDEGRMKSLKVLWSGDFDDWVLWTEGEIAGEPFGGDFEFRRAEADGRHTFRLSPDKLLRLRIRVGTSGGTLPEQKRFALGGIGTLPGYGYKEFEGNRMVLMNVEYPMNGGATSALVPFWGVGRVWEEGEALRFGNFKSNVGAALELGDPEEFLFRLSWAIPTGNPARKGRWMLRFDKDF